MLKSLLVSWVNPTSRLSKVGSFLSNFTTGITNRGTHGKPLNRNEGVEELHKQLSDFIGIEIISLGQVYNVDKTGLFYCSLPTKILADEEKCMSGHKLFKDHVPTLCVRQS